MKRPALTKHGLQGLHLTSDLTGCRENLPALRDAQALSHLCGQAVHSSGLHPVAELFHPFQPDGSGVTGVILLAESHLAVHTWPELGCVTLDVYVCNVSGDNSAKAQHLMETLVAAFGATTRVQHQLDRGGLAPSA